MRQPVLICLILIRRAHWRQELTNPVFIAADDLTPFGRDSIVQTGPYISWGRLITASGHMFSQNFEIFSKIQRLNAFEITHARHCRNLTEQLT